MNNVVNLYKGDCLTEHERIESGSVDLILTDLPYGTMKGIADGDTSWANTNTVWDSAIDPANVFAISNRILRSNGKVVLFSQEPYTSRLITGAIPNLPFSYRMIWEKDIYGNALFAKKAPLIFFEDILVFSKDSGIIEQAEYSTRHPLRDYFNKLIDSKGITKSEVIDKVGTSASHFFTNGRQFRVPTKEKYIKIKDIFTEIIPYSEIRKIHESFLEARESERERYLKEHAEKYQTIFNLPPCAKYKSNILRYKMVYDGYHPTQKPVALLEDLIRTYSNEGDHVLDLTMCSGSTGVAAANLGRRFTGIEMD